MLDTLNKVAKTVSVAFHYAAGDDDPNGAEAAIHRQRISEIWHNSAASNDTQADVAPAPHIATAPAPSGTD